MGNVKIKNTIITENLESIDFSNISIGDQIIVVNDNDDYNLNYLLEKNINDYNVFVVDRIASNLINLFKSDVNFHCEMSNNYQDIDSTYYNSYYNLLLINNKPLNVRINDYKKIPEFEKTKIFFNIKNNEKSYYENIIQPDLNMFTFHFHCKISDNTYLYINCKNIIKNYHWGFNKNVYVCDLKSEDICEICNFDRNQLINLLGQLDCNKNSSDFNKLKKMVKIINYDIKDYLNDNSILKEITDFYSDINFLSKHDIEKFFLPIYQNEDFKGYLNSRYTCFHSLDKILYTCSNDNDIETYKKITLEIRDFLLHHIDVRINPYTGEILDKDYKKVYEDAEHLMIQSIELSFAKYYFHKHDNIFISANQEEINEILELKKTIDTLLSEGGN